MAFTPRPHQSAAVDAVLDHWSAGGGNPLVSMCVGSGKSHTQGILAAKLMRPNPRIRFLGLTLTQELIKQNVDALRDVWPDAPVGINSEGLKRRDTKNPIIFAHPASIINNLRALGPRHVIMVDECHAISHDQEVGMYSAIFAELRKIIPDLRIVGLTGTPYRLTSGRLDEPWKTHKPLFDKLVYEYSILDGIRDGYIVPPIAKRPSVGLDASGVKTRGGEYVTGQAQKAVDKADLNEKIVSDILEQTRDRNSVVVFAQGVEHAEHLQQEFTKKGARAVVVEGAMSPKQRREAIDFFKRGAAKYLINFKVAGTGFDHRPIDAIALVRLSKSMGLITQFTGRGLRMSPGKGNCLVLDYGGSIQELGPIDTYTGRRIPGAPGKAPTKVCPDPCGTIHHTGVLRCNNCGYEFPRAPTKLSAETADAAILSTQQQAKWYDVQTVNYSLHIGRNQDGTDKPPSLRITYVCSPSVTPSEFLAFEGVKQGAQHFARHKWSARSITGVIPSTSKEALGMVKDLRKPARVQLRKDGKYYEVLATDFSVAPVVAQTRAAMSQADIEAALAGP
jgi:DNA repair protein RadD